MHVAEVSETAEPLIVELCKGGDETIALGRRQVVGILSDANGARGRSDHLIAVAVLCLNRHIIKTDAGASELSGCKKRDPVSINWYTKLQRRGERARGS